MQKLICNNSYQVAFGKKIENILIINQSTAHVLLSNGDRIVLEDDNPALEAVVFKFSNGTYVV